MANAQLAATNGRFRKSAKYKICQWPDCGKEYLGTPVSKFCKQHRGFKVNKPEIHDDSGLVRVDCQRGEEGPKTWFCECCFKPFTVHLTIKQKAYPKFCPLHQNKFRRELYMKQKNANKLPDSLNAPI